MTLPTLTSDRFTCEAGYRVTVQTPAQYVQRLTDAVLTLTSLTYGDYDRVSFTTAPGEQRFRALGSGRNAATQDTVSVPCVELCFFTDSDEATLSRIIEAIYHAHPYEEPVILAEACLRTNHISGLDEDNPNRFWNSAAADWVPDEHR